jgi:hypothetical protein
MSAAEFHRKHAAGCFNEAWQLIDKPDRSEAEDREMLLLAYASLWNWTQRPDCTPRNLSVGWWQVSRAHALLGEAQPAARAGRASLAHARDESPFYAGYAHEALARAAVVANDVGARDRHLEEARRCLAQVRDEGERSMLAADLDSIRKADEVHSG